MIHLETSKLCQMLELFKVIASKDLSKFLPHKKCVIYVPDTRIYIGLANGKGIHTVNVVHTYRNVKCSLLKNM